VEHPLDEQLELGKARLAGDVGFVKEAVKYFE
jgi:hypothetical protein